MVSRQVLLDSAFPTATCAPVFSARHGLSTEVAVGVEEGLKHDCGIHCDELVSLDEVCSHGLRGEAFGAAPPGVEPRARRGTGAGLSALPPSDLARIAMHPERGEESVETLIRMHAGHDRNHLAQLERIAADPRFGDRA